MHANSGVDKGMAAGGKPVEIMGMMLGRPDTETPEALIVTDVSGTLRVPFCLSTASSQRDRLGTSCSLFLGVCHVVGQILGQS